jgi:hypothetical protein
MPQRASDADQTKAFLFGWGRHGSCNQTDDDKPLRGISAFAAVVRPRRTLRAPMSFEDDLRRVEEHVNRRRSSDCSVSLMLMRRAHFIVGRDHRDRPKEKADGERYRKKVQSAKRASTTSAFQEVQARFGADVGTGWLH